ncbi:MAG: DUF790 family protein [Deltaproteobacteria bacterium]|nr:DUF790 family protein [Deltaproteobacteria bacterium]
MVSIPEEAFAYATRGPTLLPRFLGPADHPWLSVLLDEFDRSVGQTRGELARRLREVEIPGAPSGGRKMATLVLHSLVEDEVGGHLRPSVLRATLFGRATHGDKEAVLKETAEELGIEAQALRRQLFADLPPERIVKATRVPLTPHELALRTNLAFAQSLLFRARGVELKIRGRAHTIVRQARLGGLLTEVEADGDLERAHLRISGPVALFHHTLLYGRALSRLLPLLAWTEHFELTAEVLLGGRVLEFHLAAPAPIFPSEEPRRFDSKVEARFAREFARIAPDWVLVREPQPIRAERSLIFPDFLAHRRGAPEAGVWIELIGYWTPTYLARKLKALKEAKLNRLLLCVDESLGCEAAALPAHAAVVPYRGKVDAAQVVAALDALLPANRVAETPPSS